MGKLGLLIKSLEAKLRALFRRLQAGQITPDQWYTLTARLLAKYAQAALMLGLDTDTLTPEHIRVSWELMSGQLEYLDNFKMQIQNAPEFQAGWESRAASYAKAIKVPYWKGRTQMLPLPAMPAEGTQCMNNCGCYWEINAIDAGAGDYDCYWRRGKDDSCQTCIEREKQWNPLLIRGGVLVNPFVKEFFNTGLGQAVKHLAGINIPLSRLVSVSKSR